MVNPGIHAVISGGNGLIGVCAAMMVYGLWKIRKALSSLNAFDLDGDDIRTFYMQYKKDVRDFSDDDMTREGVFQDSVRRIDEHQLVFQEIPADRRVLH